jgi:hypothetical protein
MPRRANHVRAGGNRYQYQHARETNAHIEQQALNAPERPRLH